MPFSAEYLDVVPISWSFSYEGQNFQAFSNGENYESGLVDNTGFQKCDFNPPEPGFNAIGGIYMFPARYDRIIGDFRDTSVAGNSYESLALLLFPDGIVEQIPYVPLVESYEFSGRIIIEPRDAVGLIVGFSNEFGTQQEEWFMSGKMLGITFPDPLPLTVYTAGLSMSSINGSV